MFALAWRSNRQEDLDWLVKKIAGLRIFNDDEGIMNRSVVEVGGDALVVSQFTLMASTRKGNRPSYIGAAGHVTICMDTKNRE